MIKHTEIRVGNIVKMPSSGQLTVITSMDISDIQSNLKNRLTVILDEEILLKCGFEIGYPSYNLDGFELLYNKSIGYRFAADGQYVSEEIKYLHQLQNLYFALTGQELNTSGLI